MHIVDVPMVFKLSPHKLPATVLAPFSKFQPLSTISLPHQAPPLVVSHSAIFVPGDSDSSVIWQSSWKTQRIQLPPTQIEKKKLGQDKIPGIHSAITIILIK